MSRVIGQILTVAGLLTGNPWLTVIGAGLNVVEQRSAQRRARRQAIDAYNASLQDRLEMIDITPNAPRTIVLGRVRTVEGVRRRWSSGTNAEKLTMVVSFAGHEIDAFEAFYFDDVELALDGSGWVTTAPYYKAATAVGGTTVTTGGGTQTVALDHTPLAGSITATWDATESESGGQGTVDSISGANVTLSGLPSGRPVAVAYQYDAGRSTARIRPYLGTATQNVGADLVAEYPGKITATDAFAGIALAVVDVLYDPDVYPQGRPNITARLRGAKVYDPRADSTQPGGSGAQRAADATTWAYSANAALCATHYARHANGMALPLASTRVADAMAAADVCDESISIDVDDGATTTTWTGPRYTCNIVISTASNPKEVMDDLLAAMAGRDGWAGGVWRFRAGALAATAYTLRQNWLATPMGQGGAGTAEPVVIASNGVPLDAEINRVSGRAIDSTQRWQDLPFATMDDPVLIAANGEHPIEIALPAVDHPVRARHLASVLIRENQSGLRLQVRCNPLAYPVELLDVGTMDLPRYGMAEGVGKTMETIGWQWHPTQGITLQLAEITAAIYTPRATLDGTDPAPNGSLPRPTEVETIQIVDVESGTTELVDGGVLVRTRVTWTPVVSESVRINGQVEIQYAEAANHVPVGEWASWMEAGSAEAATIPALRAGRWYLFRPRAIKTTPAVRGPWGDAVAHLVAPPRPEDVQNLDFIIIGNRVIITWDAPPEADWVTVIQEPTWAGDGQPAYWEGKATAFEYIGDPGTYTFCIKHRTAGGYSVNAVCDSFTIDTAGATGTVYALRLTPPKITLDAAADGTVASFAGATSTATVVTDAGADDSANGWTFSKTDHGVASTLTGALGNVVTITGWDSATIDPLWGSVRALMQFTQSLSEVKNGWRFVHDKINGATSYVQTSGDYEVLLGDTSGSLSVGNWGLRLDEPKPIDLETGDLCIEAVVTMLTIPGRPRTVVQVVDVSAGQANAHQLYSIHFDVNGVWNIAYKNGAGQFALGTKAGSTAVVAGTRYHVALVRSGNNHDLWVNGVKETATSGTTSYRHTAGSRQILMGFTGWLFGTDGLDYMWGRIGMMRITSGTGTARYTSGTYTVNYTPPAGFAPGAFVDVVATKGATVVANTLLVELSRAAYNGGDGITAALSRPSAIVQADTNGTVPSSSLPITTTVTVVRGGANIIDLYTVTVSAPSGVTAAYAAGVLTISAVTQAFTEGTLTLTLARTGYASIPLSLPMAKTRLLTPAGTQSNPAPFASYVGGTAPQTAGIRYNTDGTIEARNIGGAWVAVGNWYSPTTGGIGSSRWLRMSGANSYSRTGMDAWVALSTQRTFDIVATAGQVQSADMRADISTDSGGATVVGYTLARLSASGT